MVTDFWTLRILTVRTLWVWMSAHVPPRLLFDRHCPSYLSKKSRTLQIFEKCLLQVKLFVAACTAMKWPWNRMMCLHGTYLVLRWSYSQLKDENTAVFRCRWSDKIHTIFKTKKFFTWSKNACLYSRSRLTVTDQDDTSRISCKKRQSRLFHAQSPQRWRLCFGHTALPNFWSGCCSNWYWVENIKMPSFWPKYITGKSQGLLGVNYMCSRR